MMKRLSIAVLISSLMLLGCQQRPSHEQGTGHESVKTPAELPVEAVTVYTAKSELFAERRTFVVGQESKLAAHLTDLRDWSPVSEGRLDAVLVDASGRETVYSVDGILRPGIFQPIVKPGAAGNFELRIRLTSPKLSDTIKAGQVTVYPDVKTALASVPEEETAGDEISFLKEQQWKIGFMTRPVAVGTLQEGIGLQGVVSPAGGREVAIAAPADGRLAVGHGRLPRLGTVVKAGEVLAVLTPFEGADTDRVVLRKEVQTALATLRLARAELARAERLFAAQAIPGKRVEEAKTAVSVAEAQLAAAKDHLAAKEATLRGAGGVTEESFHLTAPISGTVVEAKAVPGAAVTNGTPLYRIVDLRTVWVEARVPEADLNRVAGAERAEVSVAGSAPVTVGKGHGGLVTVGSVLDPTTRTAPIVYAIPNPNGAFRIGMTAQVRALTGSTLRGPVLPREAVVDDNGRSIAYVQTGGESFERRELKQVIKQGNLVQVLSTIQPGERVVTRGGYEIRLSTLSNSVPAHGHEH
jgi:RND family efflux transporter MFP subunit